MSSGQRISREKALDLAQDIIKLLQPHCDRIEIAGSLRRLRSDVGDIEIVCIPKAELDIFGNFLRSDLEITKVLFLARYKFSKNGKLFKQFDLGPCICDLYLTSPEKWGVIYTIRTGSAEFSHKLVMQRNIGGLLPSNLRVQDGRVWYGSMVMETPEEEDFFRVIGLNWIPPEQRNQ